MKKFNLSLRHHLTIDLGQFRFMVNKLFRFNVLYKKKKIMLHLEHRKFEEKKKRDEKGKNKKNIYLNSINFISPYRKRT